MTVRWSVYQNALLYVFDRGSIPSRDSDFPLCFRAQTVVLGPPEFPSAVKLPALRLTTYNHLVSRLGMNGAVTPFAVFVLSVILVSDTHSDFCELSFDVVARVMCVLVGAGNEPELTQTPFRSEGEKRYILKKTANDIVEGNVRFEVLDSGDDEDYCRLVYKPLVVWW